MKIILFIWGVVWYSPYGYPEMKGWRHMEMKKDGKMDSGTED